MIPVYDLLNHANGCKTYAAAEPCPEASDAAGGNGRREQCCVIRAGAPVAKGGEVCNTYGWLAPDHMAFHYGFLTAGEAGDSSSSRSGSETGSGGRKTQGSGGGDSPGGSITSHGDAAARSSRNGGNHGAASMAALTTRRAPELSRVDRRGFTRAHMGGTDYEPPRPFVGEPRMHEGTRTEGQPGGKPCTCMRRSSTRVRGGCVFTVPHVHTPSNFAHHATVQCVPVRMRACTYPRHARRNGGRAQEVTGCGCAASSTRGDSGRRGSRPRRGSRRHQAAPCTSVAAAASDRPGCRGRAASGGALARTNPACGASWGAGGAAQGGGHTGGAVKKRCFAFTPAPCKGQGGPLRPGCWEACSTEPPPSANSKPPCTAPLLRLLPRASARAHVGFDTTINRIHGRRVVVGGEALGTRASVSVSFTGCPLEAFPCPQSPFDNF
jgi:hypothetical protein